MLTQAQIDEFHRNGFLNGGRVLSDEELGELSDALDEILTKGPDGFAPGEAQPVSFRDLSGGGGVSEHPVWQIVNILGGRVGLGAADLPPGCGPGDQPAYRP